MQAFDLLELDGVDYRPLPLSQRKESPGATAGLSAGRDSAQRAHRRHGRARVPAGLRHGP
jgi:hypothetical protein